PQRERPASVSPPLAAVLLRLVTSATSPTDLVNTLPTPSSSPTPAFFRGLLAARRNLQRPATGEFQSSNTDVGIVLTTAPRRTLRAAAAVRFFREIDSVMAEQDEPGPERLQHL